MGWRSSFGVRGVQVLLDGVPLTLPDGQAVLDIVDPAFIRRVEIIRGPSSTFWGNGSGGVLFLATEAFRDSSFASIRGMGGSHGVRQLSAEAALPVGKHRLHGFVSSINSAGFRDFSTGGFTRTVLHANLDLGASTRLRVSAAAAVQDVESPGSLTRAQFDANPRQADIRNINAKAGKESTQAQVGATLYHETRVGLLTVTGYGLVRRLENPLSFAYIDLDRRVGGARVQLQNSANRADWGIGMDAGIQHDNRLNLNNVGGVPGEELKLDQRELVRNVSAFAHGRFSLIGGLTAAVGIRGDVIRFSLDDRFLNDGNQTGDRNFSAVSPSFGLSYQFGSQLLFVNVSTAFETPTTTEVVNQPDGSAGLNAKVGAQKTRGVEAGARGSIGGVAFDVAVFRLDVSDRLLPFQDDEGRTYYRNAGENTHRGVEIALIAPLMTHTTLQATYTGSRFEFDDDIHRGNRIPGVPDHHLFVGVRTRQHGLLVQVSAEFVSDAYADNGNESRNNGYVLADVLAGYTDLRLGQAHVQPFVKASNVLDTGYAGSLVVNAFGGRYFEPSPGRTFQFGVSVSL